MCKAAHEKQSTLSVIDKDFTILYNNKKEVCKLSEQIVIVYILVIGNNRFAMKNGKVGGAIVAAKEISMAVIKRLPKYYRNLGELLEKQVERISSKELSERMQVTASQIRQDLNNFGGFGQQGYGYNVEYLYTEIGKILGLTRKYHMIVIGAGNLGQAIANYTDFEKLGFVLECMFDQKESLIGTEIRGVKIADVSELEEYMKHHAVDIAAITIPKDHAPELAASLVKWGARAIWNFAPTDLHLPEEVKVQNVHLADSLMRLSYSIKKE